MAVNENVYGLSETWLNCYYQQSAITDKNKKANFGDSNATLLKGVTNSKISYSEPLDKSLSYCGLGTESALSHIAYVGVDSSYTPMILDIQDRFVTNFGFFEKTTNNSFTAPSPIFSVSEMNYVTWSSSINLDRNYSPYLEPITKINPHNLVLLIKVRACRSFNSGSIDVDLKTYLTTYKTTHTHIKQVYVTAYFGNVLITPNRSIDAGQGTLQNRIPLQLAILDEYEHTSKNLKFYMYGFPYMPVFGNFNTSDSVYRHSTNGFGMVAHTENSKEHIKLSTIDSSTVECYTEYYNDFENDILKTVACFGLYFTPVTATAENGTLTSSEMYIGLLDENGIGHGNYLQGADTVNAPQNEYTDMTQSGYDYTKEVDKTKYDNSTHFNLNLSLGAFTKFYQLTESQVNDLCSALYNVVNAQPSGTSIEEYNMKCFLTNNPIDCIISLKKFPLNHFPSVGVPNDLYLGTVDTGIDAPLVLSTTWIYYFDFSNSTDTGLFAVNGGAFLDFEPYTTIQINVPFCGSFEVPTTYFHKYGGVRVALMIDFITGACTAYLLVNNDVVDSVSGSCSVDLPVTGLQSATLDGNIHNASMMKEKQQTSLLGGLIAGAVSIGVGLATGSLPLAVGGGAAIIGSFMSAEDTGKQINYNVEHMQLPLKQVGAASGAIAQCNDYRCKMIIKRPVLMNYDKEVYAKTIGYACLLNGIVDNFTGLTIGKIEAETIQNGITDEERTMIESLFASGVIL